MSGEIKQVLGIDASQALQTLKQLDSGYASFEARINSVAATLAKFNQNNTAAAASKLAPALKSSAQAADQANASIGRLTVSTGLIARILTTQLVVSMFGKFRREIEDVTREAADFQKQIALITTIADGASFDQIAAGVRSISDNFNIPLLQAAEGVYNALSNQVGDFGQSLEFTAEAAKFAKATNSTLKDSVDLLSGALQSFGLDASQTGKVASIFFTAIDKGRVTATELANTFGRIGPQAQAAGLSLEDTAAAIASISIKGSKTSESLTQLRGILTGLIKPTPALRKALEDLGFTESTSALSTLGFAKTLEQLSKSTGGSQQALAQLFPNVRGLSGELALSGDEFKTLIDNIKAMESQGAEFAAQKALQATNTDAERVTSAINKLRNELVTGLGQGALDVADKLLTLSGGVDNIISTSQNAIPAIGGITAAILALRSEAILGAGALSSLATGAGVLLAGGFAGNFIGKQIDDALTKNLLAQTKALEQGDKALLEDQKKLFAERLSAAQATDKARVQSAKDAVASLGQTYIQDLDNARAANTALVSSTKSATEKMVSLRQQLVQELAQAASDSEQAVKDSAGRIAALQAKQSDRDFSGRIGGLSDVQQFAALAQRADQFARDAAQALSSAVSPEQIQKALALFDKAQSTGDTAKSIAQRTGNRTLELQAVSKLKGITDQQISAEQQLQSLQRGRLPGLQAEADKQRDIVQKIREQVEILNKNTGNFDENGKQFSSADLAKRTANRQAAEKQLAGLGLKPQDFAQIALLGLGDFLTKSGQKLKQQPLQLAFDVEKGTADIQQRLNAAFSKLKVKLPFDVGGLESVVGKLENPDQIISGLDKIGQAADVVRRKLADAFNLDQQKSLLGSEIDQLFNEIDQRAGVRSTGGAGLAGQFKDLTTQLQTLRNNPFITQEEVQKAIQARDAFAQTALANKQGQLAFSTSVQAVDAILVKFQQIANLQKNAVNTQGLQQSLQPLDNLLNQLNPKLEATGVTLQTQVDPAAAAMKQAFQDTDFATLNINGQLLTTKTAAEEIAGSAQATAAAYQAAAAAASQITASKSEGTTAAHGRYLTPEYMAGGGFVPRGMDTIPVMARAGETIINPDSSRKFFSQLQAINAGKQPIFRSQGGSVTNVGDIHVHGASQPEVTARRVMRAIRREQRRGTAR